MDVLVTRDPKKRQSLAALADAVDAANARVKEAESHHARLAGLARQKKADIRALEASMLKVEAAPNRLETLMRGEADPSPEQVKAARKRREHNAEIGDRIEAARADLDVLNGGMADAGQAVEEAKAAVDAANEALVNAIGAVMVDEIRAELVELVRRRVWPLQRIADRCFDKAAAGGASSYNILALQFVERYIHPEEEREAAYRQQQWAQQDREHAEALRRVMAQEAVEIEKLYEARITELRRPGGSGLPGRSLSLSDIKEEVRRGVVAKREPLPGPGPCPTSPISAGNRLRPLRDLAKVTELEGDPDTVFAALVSNLRADPATEAAGG